MQDELLDSGDKDSIEELLISPGYALVRKRIQDEIARLQATLEGDLEMPATYKVRGQIAGFRTALSIPEILISEVPVKEKRR